MSSQLVLGESSRANEDAWAACILESDGKCIGCMAFSPGSSGFCSICLAAAVKKLKRSTCSVEDCKAAFLARLNEDLKAVATPSPAKAVATPSPAKAVATPSPAKAVATPSRAKASGYIILSTEELVVSDEDDDDVIVELEARQHPSRGENEAAAKATSGDRRYI